MASILGVDLSHWNEQSHVDEVNSNSECVFAILKATEGKSMVDEKCSEWYKQLYEKKVIGFYHYAHPELNDMVTEARHFVSTVQNVTAFNPDAKYFLALDWEGKAITYSYVAALLFLDEVQRLTGIKPLFYTSQSTALLYDPISKYDYGLWVARYNTEIGDIGAWKNAAMWQYSNKPFDKDRFFGTKEQLLKYCNPDTASAIPGTEELACYFECGDIDKCPIARWINGLD